MNRYTIEEFVQNTQEEDKGEGVFELETPRLLEINLTDTIWAKTGSMVSYRGKIKFEREGVFEHGVSKMFKKMLSGEGTSLMKATGDGKLYVADQGKKSRFFDWLKGSLFSLMETTCSHLNRLFGGILN